jgi:5-methyltetrahydrofolate--homocysteine methyltransferase
MPQNDGGRAVYKMTPAEMSKILEDFLIKFHHVRIIGGCCGTNADHIHELRNMLVKNHKGNPQ